MAGLGVEISADGVSAIAESLAGVGDRASDLRPLADTLGLIFQADVDERFDTAPGARQSGRVYGGATWESLTDRYLKANPRRERGQQLRDTGELLQSFQVGGKGNVFDKYEDGVVFGSILPKAIGLNRKRPILFYHDALIDQLVAAVEIYVAEGL